MSTKVLRVRLPYCPEPAATFARLSNGGRTVGTALLESAATGSSGTRRSLLAVRSALRIVLAGSSVTLQALNNNGRMALARIATATSRSCGDDDTLHIGVPDTSTEPCDEAARLRSASVFDPLRTVLDILAPDRRQDRAQLRLVGALAFELAARFDSLPVTSGELPDYVFLLPDLMIDIVHHHGHAELSAVAFDQACENDLAGRLRNLLSTLETQSLPPPQISETPVAITNCDDAAFRQRVSMGREAVVNGDVFQVVLSRYWETPCDDPFAAYLRLIDANPSPYLFYFCDESATLFGASPESAVRVDAANREVDLYPVAGTRPRGADADEDARLEAELRLNAKEVAEHMMLVDLARNDIARVCEPGSRQIARLLGVDRYAHVMHLVSRVSGKLRKDLDALHALRACLNVGTLSGAPKLRACELIRGIENEPRGYYGGAVGWLDAAGNLDTAITIRSVTVRGGVARAQAGAGVVLDSDAQAEADETRNKARAVLNALSVREEVTS